MDSALPARKNASRGGIPRERLEPLVVAGLSIRAIAQQLQLSYATVQHWLKMHGLKTRRAEQRRGSQARTVRRECPVHGLTTFVKYSATDHHRCAQCRKDRVVARRRKVKAVLVEEAGGRYLLWLRPLRRRAPVPPPRPVSEIVRPRRSRRRSIIGALPRGGAQVRAALRELPCGG